MSDEPKFCPQCGAELDRREDFIGVAYQCDKLDCLGFFDEGEILEKEPPNE